MKEETKQQFLKLKKAKENLELGIKKAEEVAKNSVNRVNLILKETEKAEEVKSS